MEDPSVSNTQPSYLDHDVRDEWRIIQDKLRDKIITENVEEWQNDISLLQHVAGLDISYRKEQSDGGVGAEAYAALVICKYPGMDVVYQDVESCHLDVPYVPGFLAFRELQPLLKLVNNVVQNKKEIAPNVILVDGNGLLHPQKCGIACHIGVHTSICTIGVAKNMFQLEDVDFKKETVQNMPNVGDHILIKDKDDKVLGMALKSTSNTRNPIYVSIGHKISLETAREIVLSCCKYRVPEPVRIADHISREAIRQNFE